MQSYRNDQSDRPDSLLRLASRWQAAHFDFAFDHFAFAANHSLRVQLETARTVSETLTEVEFVPSGGERHQFACEPGHRVGARQSRVVRAEPSAASGVRRPVGRLTLHSEKTDGERAAPRA